MANTIKVVRVRNPTPSHCCTLIADSREGGYSGDGSTVDVTLSVTEARDLSARLLKWADEAEDA